MNKNEIMQILPHRDPMLLIEEAELVDGVSIAKYTVRGDEFFLGGHFPGNPVVPGVILCEMMAQASCLLINKQEDGVQYTPYFTSMDKVKFRNPVMPKDCIVLKSELVREKHPFYFVKTTASVGDKICASGELSFALVESEK